MVNWEKLETDVGEWSNDNFGDQPAVNPFIGSGEEFGELVEELYSDNISEEEVKDAVGDILVFLADYCYRYGISYSGAAGRMDETELYTGCNTIEELCVEMSISRGNQAYSYLKQDQGIREERDGVGSVADEKSLAHTLLALHTFSESYGFTIEEAIDTAVSEALERDWDSTYN